MKHTEKITPVAAVVSAIATLACCLPATFAAAAATASLGAIAAQYRSWLIGFSAVLLAVAFIQMSRTARACGRRSNASLVVFWVSLGIVVTVVLFPQVLAAVLADWVS
jgi:hypothetical protein